MTSRFARPWIVMDLDDSACDFGPHVYHQFGLHYGPQPRMDRLADYDMHRQMGIALDVFYERLDTLQIYETVPPHPHMQQALNVASERGWLVQWTTARGRARNAKTVTLRWLHEYEFPVDALHITEAGQCKTDVLPENTIITVEDSHAHCASYTQLGVPINLLIDRPWNSALRTPAGALRKTSQAAAQHILDVVCRSDKE